MVPWFLSSGELTALYRRCTVLSFLSTTTIRILALICEQKIEGQQSKRCSADWSGHFEEDRNFSYSITEKQWRKIHWEQISLHLFLENNYAKACRMRREMLLFFQHHLDGVKYVIKLQHVVISSNVVICLQCATSKRKFEGHYKTENPNFWQQNTQRGT